MSIDPMALVQASRPGPAIEIGNPVPGALRRVRDTVVQDHTGVERSANELAGLPGSPGYLSRIPPPACAVCGGDHVPGHIYNHEYQREAAESEAMSAVNGAIVPASSVQQLPSPTTTVLPVVPAQRVNIIPGRGEDAFIVGIEAAPDWDLVDSWKLTTDQLLPMLPILRGLGVKIRDNTAGELKSLEMGWLAGER
jgi:hypothetical protein